jgi:hypothetical protein
MPKIGRQVLYLCCVVLISFTGGCRNAPDRVPEARGALATNQQDPPSATFKIKPANEVTLPNIELYDCLYQARGKTAKFRLQVRQDRPAAGKIPMAPAEGKFIAVSGSDGTAMLEDLLKALEAKHLPTQSMRNAEVAFDAVVLGENQSRSSSGGFSGKPRGDWKLLKLFFPKGGDDGEVYLNLNPISGEAEFAIKDPDYGDYVLAQLAKVM